MNLVAISGTDGTGRDRAYKVRSLLQSLLSALLRSRLSALLSALKMAPKPFENGPYNCSKTALKSIREPLGAVWAAWRSLGGLLERSWSALGGIRGPNKVIGSALGRPKSSLETGFSHLGGQIPSQKVPRRVPNRGPKAIQAENGETLIFNDGCKDFNDF